jgi:hypothetical protein
MKKSILFSFMMLIFGCAIAQDKLYKPDGSVIDAKITEVSQSEVKFKKLNNLDGPTFVIQKSELLMIVYSNGETEVITKEEEEENRKEKDEITVKTEKPEYGRNILAINPIGFVFKDLSLSYEAISKSGYIGLKIPMIAGIDERIVKSGLYLKIYPTKQGQVRGFIGPGFHLGAFTATNMYTYGYYAILFNVGVAFQPTKMFNLSIEANTGSGFIPARNTRYIEYNIALNLGLRF